MGSEYHDSSNPAGLSIADADDLDKSLCSELPWTIGITGASGLVGTALTSILTTAGHQAIAIPRLRESRHDGAGDWFSLAAIESIAGASQHAKECGIVLGPSAVIHLAGEPVGAGKWTVEKKSRIRDSRVLGTRSLCEQLARMEKPPRVLLCASAVGYYGNRGDEILDEQCGPGEGFLATVAQEWEAATEPAIARGIRVVFLRFGMILASHGGALAKLLRPFKMGLGGRYGEGTQYWSWIAMDDVLGAIEHILMHERIFGPVNMVAPQMVTNAEFADTLGRVLHRPAVFSLPAWVTKQILGELGEELLLASERVTPLRLVQSGYVFQYGNLTDALWHLLKPKKAPKF